MPEFDVPTKTTYLHLLEIRGNLQALLSSDTVWEEERCRSCTKLLQCSTDRATRLHRWVEALEEVKSALEVMEWCFGFQE